MKSLVSKVRNKLYLLKRFLYQKTKRKISSKKLVFIMGCQRSGTSMLMDVFYRDINLMTYKEHEAIFYDSGKKSLRLKDVHDVEFLLEKDNVAVVVAKPLLDSQRVNELLDQYENSQCIWIYRNYKDVALSNLKQFGEGNGHKDMAYVLNIDREDWRGEKTSAETLAAVKNYYDENSSNIDAAAMFWYVRNKIFFDNNLQNNRQVKLCRYEDLVSRPEDIVSGLYDFIAEGDFDVNIVSDVHARSVSKGSSVSLSPAVNKLCEDLLLRFDENH